MTAPVSSSGDRVDFEALTDRFRILPTSQRWSAVLMSMDRLASLAPDERHKPEFQDDVLNVQGFATTIRKNGKLIARSIACAAALARFGRVGDKVPIYKALETLSLAYRFTSLSTDAVLSLLGDVWDKLQAYGAVPTVELAPVLSATDTAAYFEAIQSVLTKLRTLGPIPTDKLGMAQSAAWDSVYCRYEDIVRGRPERAPNVAEAACRIANVPPASTLAFSTRDTPATAWANLLLATSPAPGVRVNTPAGALIVACHALGFRSLDRDAFIAMFRYLDQWVPGPDQHLTIERDVPAFLERNDYVLSRPPQQQAVFVIRRDIDSLVTRWPTCETVATLPMTRQQVQALLGGKSIGMKLTRTQPSLPELLRAPRDCAVAIEYPPDSPDAEGLAELLRASLSTQPRKTDSRVLTVGFGPSDARYDREAFIPSPTRYEDLVPASLFSRSRSQIS
jgi:hypothetical protein